MTLAMLLTEMKEPEAGKSYFAACLSADQAGTAEWSVFTGWVRTKSRRPAIEIRQASAVVPTIQISQWVKLGERYTILAKPEHLFMFYRTGGNALIEASFARQALPLLLKPIECRRSGVDGFLPAADLTQEAFQRAPTPKLRTRVLERDQFRCRLCGERPADNVHVVLHVHHIRPWSSGGVTTEDNLITLCGTCHNGLDPHFRPHLFDKIRGHDRSETYLHEPPEVRQYRDRIRAFIEANWVLAAEA